MTLTPERTEAEPTRRSLGSLLFGLILIAVGAVWLLDRLDVVEVDRALILPLLLTVIGMALIAGSWDGAHNGMVGFGVVLAVLALLAAVTPVGSISGGVGQRHHAPVVTSDLQPEYAVGVGQLEVDLRNLTLIRDEQIDIRVGAGDVVVRIPERLLADIQADVSAGEIVLFGSERSGLDVSQRWESAEAPGADHTLQIDIEVVAGKIEVTR